VRSSRFQVQFWTRCDFEKPGSSPFLLAVTKYCCEKTKVIGAARKSKEIGFFTFCAGCNEVLL